MPRIAVTSDLHYDQRGFLTAPKLVRVVVEAMVGAGAEALLVAGDIGHPLDNFCRCLDLFAGRGVAVGVVAGNHDVWRDEHHSSRKLWEEVLPVATRQRGCHWLESDAIAIGRTAIVGSMAWYDYSAAAPDLGFAPAYFEQAKPRISNDALWIDWPWTDIEVAGMLRNQLARRLQSLQADESIDRVVVLTHVPLFDQQMLRNPSNLAWSVANAYFGNLRTGSVVAAFPKVRLVASGHLHTSREATIAREGMPDLRTLVVGSDYGAPSWVLVDV